MRARRLITGGGGRLNGTVIIDETRLVSLAGFTGEGMIKVSAGKKRHAVVRAV